MVTRVFFYGLYMDAALLESMGFRPRPVGAARLDGHELTIGTRANLVPAAGTAAYGLLHDLAPEEVSALYARPEVRGYVPKEVVATLLEDGSSHDATCYVLDAEERGATPDVGYARRLAALGARLGLPREFEDRLARFVPAD